MRRCFYLKVCEKLKRDAPASALASKSSASW
ncbi:hypothetical protein [Klebsiella pneumoniae]